MGSKLSGVIGLGLLLVGCGGAASKDSPAPRTADSRVSTSEIEKALPASITEQLKDDSVMVDRAQCARTDAAHASCVVNVHNASTGDPSSVHVDVEIDNTSGTYVWHVTS